MSKKLALFGGDKTFTEKVERYNSIDSSEVHAVKKVIESGILSQYLGEWDADFYGGPKVKEFEETRAMLVKRQADLKAQVESDRLCASRVE